MLAGSVARGQPGGFPMFARLALALCLWSCATTAFAQSSVVVLGIRSVEGDDDVANTLTDKLRESARAVTDWAVSDAAVSMAQMSLAHGCDELDAACLSDIAKALQASRVLYGTMQRTSARADYSYALTLSLFDAESGAIARSVDDTIPQADSTPEAMAPHAAKLIERLASTETGGSITIQANLASATVLINDQPVGETQEGALRLTGLEPGQYKIVIRSDGYADHVSTVTVSEGADTSLAAVLSPSGATSGSSYDGGGGHQLQWLGWTLLGVSAASAIGFVTSVIVVGNVNDDPLFKSYKDMVARYNEAFEMAGQRDRVEPDSCEAAEKGLAYDLSEDKYQEVVDLCQTGGTFEVLQYVFGIGAVVTGAAGAVVLLTAGEGESEAAAGAHKQPRLALQPSVSPNHAYMSATLRF
jgi:hypothetical protein